MWSRSRLSLLDLRTVPLRHCGIALWRETRRGGRPSRPDLEHGHAVEHAPPAARRTRTPLALLELAAELSMDGRRRIAGTCGVVVAATRRGARLFIGSEVPEPLVPALRAAARTAPRAPGPDHEPPALAS